MKKVWATHKAVERGVLSAIEVNSEEIKKVHLIEKEIIDFAEENRAITNDGNLKLVLLEVRGEQKFFPQENLAYYLSNFAINQL